VFAVQLMTTFVTLLAATVPEPFATEQLCPTGKVEIATA
jgi:hypothetical protein